MAHEAKLAGSIIQGMRHDLGLAESWLKVNIAYGVEVYGRDWLDELCTLINKSSQ